MTPQHYELETQALETCYQRVHQNVFGGSWVRRLLPMPTLLRSSDFASAVAELRGMEDRLRIIRLACLSCAGSPAEIAAALRLGTAADALHATMYALRRICQRMDQRREGVRYAMDDFAADIERYNACVESYRNLTMNV